MSIFDLLKSNKKSSGLKMYPTKDGGFYIKEWDIINSPVIKKKVEKIRNFLNEKVPTSS